MKHIKHLLIISLPLLLAACAKGAESEWASYNDPDHEEQQLPDEDEIGPEQTPVDGDNGGTTPTPKPPTTTPTPQPQPEPPSAPNPKLIFFSDGKLYKLAHGNGQYWDGCKSTALARGGYLSDSTCGRALFHPSFMTHLNKNYHSCVEKAAQSAGYSQPTRSFLNHMGSYVNRNARNSSSLSMHAYARALDIKNFNLIDSRGNVTRISTNISDYKGAVVPFYDTFRACWKATISHKCKSTDREGNGSIGHTKSKLGGNTLHNDHIHLSYPTCAGA